MTSRRPLTLLSVLSLVLLLTSALRAQAPPPLSATPPMGWNSWNWFAGKVTDADIRQAADLLVSSGMRDSGYIYVNIDDTWQGKRDASGAIHPNDKFPDMKALAAYVHGKGLKIGIYSSPGPTTCAGYEGSYGHEQQDAATYAAWGIDYLKYDLCSFGRIMQAKAPNDPRAQYKLMREAYQTMHQALWHTGRPIVYSLCQYGFDSVWQWGPSVGAQLWRTQGDIEATIDSITRIGRAQAGLAPFAGPGHWNDPDMLEVGNGKLTPAENRLHMAMWAMLAAPLIAGNNLTQMTPDTKSILLDKDLIALDQDPLGKQAERIFAEGPLEIWSRALADGSTMIAIINFRDYTIFAKDHSAAITAVVPNAHTMTELTTKHSYSALSDIFAEPLAPYAVRLVRLK